MSKLNSCDIFCRVVDNYGDIGVCWRLARQLANEHGIAVRLWVDDLGSFCKLCPQVDMRLAQQHCHGVEIRHWDADAFPSHTQPPSRPDGHPLPQAGEGLGEREVADLVIEAFACELPHSYVAAMARISEITDLHTKMDARRQGREQRGSTKKYGEAGEDVANEAGAAYVDQRPVWINLEYLSAEDWVAGCHKLPSPHPTLPLVKYFFFPGFTAHTGGLLLERGLLARRDAFQRDMAATADYWKSLGVSPRQDEICVSLFSYENSAVAALLDAWAQGATPVLCLVPEGRVLPQVAAFFGHAQGVAGNSYARGNLRVHVLPFVEQQAYDTLLWACDVNFVRGEDSCVRAQWAARPCVWHIYPQHDGAHMHKLRALSALYSAGLEAAAAQALQGLWLAWNGEGEVAVAWHAFARQRESLTQHAKTWAASLAQNNLTLNLLDFSREVGRIRAFEMQAGRQI